MDYYIFYSFFNDTIGGSVTVKIIGMDYDRQLQAYIVHFVSDLSCNPDSFLLDDKSQDLFIPFMLDGQIEKLKDRCFQIDYDFEDFDAAHEEQYFDCDEKKQHALLINGMTEVASDVLDF